VAAARSALSAAPPGAVGLQLRAKTLAEAHRQRLGEALGRLCAERGVPLLINGSLELAKRVGAQGVQLPEAGPSIAEARRQLGAGACIGASCHDRAGLERAAAAGADFATLSPVHVVAGKGEPLGEEGFAELYRGLALPIFALGGIDVAAARRLASRGIGRLAVIRAVMAAPDPAARVGELLAVLARVSCADP